MSLKKKLDLLEKNQPTITITHKSMAETAAFVATILAKIKAGGNDGRRSGKWRRNEINRLTGKNPRVR